MPAHSRFGTKVSPIFAVNPTAGKATLLYGKSAKERLERVLVKLQQAWPNLRVRALEDDVASIEVQSLAVQMEPDGETRMTMADIQRVIESTPSPPGKQIGQ